MNNIRMKTYCDGFFRLETEIGGKLIAVIYSNKTTANDALYDFKQVMEKELSKYAPQK